MYMLQLYNIHTFRSPHCEYNSPSNFQQSFGYSTAKCSKIGKIVQYEWLQDYLKAKINGFFKCLVLAFSGIVQPLFTHMIYCAIFPFLANYGYFKQQFAKRVLVFFAHYITYTGCTIYIVAIIRVRPRSIRLVTTDFLVLYFYR